MPSSNEDPVQKEKQAIKITRGDKPKNISCSKYKCIVPILALIVALAALGTAILNKQLQKQLTEENASFATQLKELEQKQNSTQEQIATKTNSTEETQTKLHAKFDNLSKQLQNAMQQKFYQNQDWILLKARYYLELAQINTHWSDSSDSAIALLEEADQVLQHVNAPQIFEIRQAIAKDIAQIQAIPRVDVVGLLSQLDAAQNSINDLSIPLPANDKTTENTTIPANNSSSWRLHLQDSMKVLEQFVVIRRHDENVQPLISPLLENLIKENLHLNLQEAQWAILNNNPSVYQLVLKQAIKKLKINFNENIPTTAALIKKLTDLEQINIIPKRADIGSALPLLNRLIDTNKNQTPQSLGNEQGGKQ